ncbi:MAG: D-alanine--D-alanine ligase [Candidatus Komeilibacteria bacterium]|jgi:D-alanine-D-alanine ligase|nr:D-alanine--D-alanine ligase [Candidatus Komeilibacteria bacterium]MBT4447696.1 D-alanine--D-alanine ligase [Candidatus Komeilibacteria bacterium]
MRIAVLTGGTSSEREVALASSENVIQALKKNYEVTVFDFPKDLDKFLAEYKKYQAAVPVFHGPGGEDGVVQGFLKTLGVPFIFSDVEAHAVGMDKYLSKYLAEKIGLLLAGDQILNKLTKIEFKKAVVIKPLAGGSSIGISIAHNQADLDKSLEKAFKYSDKVLVEDYIEGKELTVPIIDKDGEAFALPVIEIRSKNSFFDYESKYDNKLVEELCPALIDNKLAEELQAQALKMHLALGARHISRSDFIVDEDKIYFLEINTIPGMTNNSLLPKAIQVGGEDFANLLDIWIKSVISG